MRYPDRQKNMVMARMAPLSHTNPPWNMSITMIPTPRSPSSPG